MSRKKFSLENAKALAESRGGTCVSTECNDGTKSRLMWKCHIAKHPPWVAEVSGVKSGRKTWCGKCAHERRMADNLSRANTLAIKQGGKCLTTENFSVWDVVEFECRKKHRFSMLFHNMITAQASWCQECDRARRGVTILTIESAHEIAAENGGFCLSTDYKCNDEPLEWECAEGHRWSACLHNVKDAGSWCPTCVLSNEAICFGIIAAMFQMHSFAKRRGIDWLRTEKDEARLELDMFCPRLSLAVEYNGKQHYQVVPRFHPRGEADLLIQQSRDSLKAELCEKNEVSLIVVPCMIHKSVSRLPARTLKLAEFIWHAVNDLGFPEGTHCSLEELLAGLGL